MSRENQTKVSTSLPHVVLATSCHERLTMSSKQGRKPRRLPHLSHTLSHSHTPVHSLSWTNAATGRGKRRAHEAMPTHTDTHTQTWDSLEGVTRWMARRWTQLRLAVGGGGGVHLVLHHLVISILETSHERRIRHRVRPNARRRGGNAN